MTTERTRTIRCPSCDTRAVVKLLDEPIPTRPGHVSTSIVKYRCREMCSLTDQTIFDALGLVDTFSTQRQSEPAEQLGTEAEDTEVA